MDAHDDAAPSLVLAVILGSDAPLLLLSGDFHVVAGSMSFCRAFGVDPATLTGLSFLAIGNGEWNTPQLASLLGATASGAADIQTYEFDLQLPGRGTRHLVLSPRRLEYDDKDRVLLLLAITDVTDARASEKLKDDLIRDKAVLLREVQHRIANSLQIIASVLLQSARRVQSAETRSHLKDAHSRVMSIASVQLQLAQTTAGNIALRPYFLQLCASLGASMIEDPARLSLRVTVDDTVVSSESSISLGLIVTELVINALKHAFPDGRAGSISVDYRAEGSEWTLSVADDGVGMSAHPEAAKAGLGTSIVEALARQLGADIRIGHSSPGTTVNIVHDSSAAGTATDRQNPL